MLLKHVKSFPRENRESIIQNRHQVFRHMILINFHMMMNIIIVKLVITIVLKNTIYKNNHNNNNNNNINISKEKKKKYSLKVQIYINFKLVQ